MTAKLKSFSELLFHPEILSILTMFSPSVVCLIFLHKALAFPPQTSNPDSTIIVAISCMIHFPFSSALHFYRATGNNPSVRTFLYRLDVTFIHFHAWCQTYAWYMKLSHFDTLYQFGAVAYMWTIDPIAYPWKKRVVDILAFGAGIISYRGLYQDKEELFYYSILIGVVSYAIHSQKLIGEYSSVLFHLLLAGPQYCFLTGLNGNIRL